jgi:predicted acylesterase/phospholipase RssA
MTRPGGTGSRQRRRPGLRPYRGYRGAAGALLRHRRDRRLIEFHRAVEVIAAGRALAAQALDTLEMNVDEPAAQAIEG